MTENELKKLNERLAKAVGITFDWQGTWILPDSGEWVRPIPFTSSMDACLKHILPHRNWGEHPSWIIGYNFKVFQTGIECELTIENEAGIDTVTDFAAFDPLDDLTHIDYAKYTPLAFCLAADKYLREVNNANKL